MNLTPRQITAYLDLNNDIDGIENANNLTIAALGAQADKKSIETAIKEFLPDKI